MEKEDDLENDLSNVAAENEGENESPLDEEEKTLAENLRNSFGREKRGSVRSERLESVTSIMPDYELCVRLCQVPGSWNPLKFKKPKKPTESVLPELQVAKKRYCPPPLTSASIVSMQHEKQKYFCLFGGIVDTTPVNDVWLYDIDAKKWVAVQEGKEDESDKSPKSLQRKKLRAQKGYEGVFPQARCGHSAVAVNQNKEMIMFGGANICTAAYYNDLWSFDIEAHEWTNLSPSGKLPEPRWQCSAVTIEDRMFLYAGEGQHYNMLGDVNVYSHANQQWLNLRTVFPNPPPRMMHAAACIGDKMYVVGGRGKERLCDVWCLEARTSMWTQVKWRGRASPFMMPDGSNGELYGHVAIPYNNKIVVHGGKLGGNFTGMAWILDTTSLTWHAMEADTNALNSPSARWKHCATTITDTNYTPAMSDFTPLSQLNLGDEEEMTKWITAQKESIYKQSHATGLLSSIGCNTVLSSTDCGIIFGGGGPAKRLSDLWSLTLA